MVTTDSIRRSVESGLPCEHVEVTGDGQHFEAIIVSAAFATILKKHTGKTPAQLVAAAKKFKG